MKILLFGKDGQVGWELQRSLAPLGELVTLGSKDRAPCGDLTDLSGITDTINTLAPQVIVNAAAYTAVDRAEQEPELAAQINAEAPGAIASAAKRCGALLVHYSTDYVFDGSGQRAWQEDDPMDPSNVYGASKADGERAITASGCKHLIFRTSWVYAARGNNFLKTMLKLARERESLNVIDDQHGAPTSAELIADVTTHAIRATLDNPALPGTYHLAPTGTTSWFDYARLAISFAREIGMPTKVLDKDIHAISTSGYPTPAARPLNSRLNTEKLQTAFSLTLPGWEIGVKRAVTEILQK